MKALKITGMILSFLLAIVAIVGTYVKTALPNTGDAPDLSIDRTKARIQRGEYLANHVTVCMDCHSTRDWNRYSGPVTKGSLGAGGEKFDQEMGFPGKFYAPNITPHGLGSWTDGEILRAVTTGVSKNGKALFPVMGYQRFGQMDREDVLSIIVYIRQLSPVKKDNPASEAAFPMSLLINTLPKAAAFKTRPSENDEVAYGKYLVLAAGCVDCHSKTEKGNVIEGTEFGGGMEFGNRDWIIRSANITMHRKTGIGQWTKEDFIQRFKVYDDTSQLLRPVRPGEVNTPMPWAMFGGMKERDLGAIYAYLSSLAPIDNQVVRLEKRTKRD